MTTAPCYNCPDRFPACHDQCERFREWKSYKAAEKDRARERDRIEADVVAYECDRRRRLFKK